MCIFTLIQTKEGYIAGSNRDDQESRMTDSQVFFDEEKQISYVRDQVGGGTWLAMHTSGLLVVLLNKSPYLGKGNDSKLTTRGKLVIDLIESENQSSLLNDESLKLYNSFHVAVCKPTGEGIYTTLYNRDAIEQKVTISNKTGSLVCSASTLYTEQKQKEREKSLSFINSTVELLEFLQSNIYDPNENYTIAKEGVVTKSHSIISYDRTQNKTSYEFMNRNGKELE